MEDKVYAFLYTPCIYESSFSTMSLHRSKKGAYRAMRGFIEESYREWRESGLKHGKQDIKHGAFENWRVAEINIYD